jgi:hypothetical protein
MNQVLFKQPMMPWLEKQKKLHLKRLKASPPKAQHLKLAQSLPKQAPKRNRLLVPRQKLS